MSKPVLPIEPGPETDLAALRQAEAQYRWLFASNPAPMFIYRRGSLALLTFNDAFLALYGYSAEQARALRLTDLYLPADHDEVVRRVGSMRGLVNAGRWRHVRRDGSVVHTVVQSHDIEHEGHACRLGVITDVTALERSQQRDRQRLALMERLARGDSLASLLEQLARDHEALFPHSLCSILLLDDSGQPPAPDAAPNLAACWSEPIIGSHGRVLGSFAVYRRQPATPSAEELDHLSFSVQLAATAITHGAATRQLREGERRLQSILHAMPDLVFLKDTHGVYQASNLAFERFLNLAEDQIVGRTDEQITDPASAALFRAADAQATAQKAPLVVERWLHFKRDGYRGLFQVVKTPLFDEAGQPTGVLGVARDITESRRDEARIQRLNRSYALLSNVNEAIVRLRDREALFAELCRIAVQVGGFDMAWLGVHDPASATVSPVAWAGQAEDYQRHLQLSVAAGRSGPVPTAFHSGQPQVVPDVTTEPTLAHRLDTLLAMGLRSLAVFPIALPAGCWYCLTVYSGADDHFDAEQVALLSRLARDIEFALQFIAAEKARGEAQRFREQLIESVAGLFFALDPAGRLLLWNHRLEEVTGYSAAELASHSAADFFDPAERAVVTARIAKVLAQGESTAQATLVSRDGKRVPYLFVARRFDAEAGPLLVGTGIDISDRVRSERELARHREQLEELVHQRTTELEAVNTRLQREDRRLRAMLGLSQRASSLDEAQLLQLGLAEILLQTASSLGCVHGVNSTGQELTLLAWAGTEKPPTPEFARQVLARRQPHAASGEGGFQRVLGAPVFEAERAVMVVCVGNKPEPYDETDQRQLQLLASDLWQIVQRRRTEIALGKAKIAADAANMAKSAFVANMSHEIRTPMNAIIGFAHLLRRDPLTPRQQDQLGKIADAGQHLMQIINDILDFSKIEARKLTLEQADFDLRQSLDRVQAMQSDTARAKQLPLRVDLDAGCPQLLRGDRLRLEQVLLNLLSNAIKFTERGQIDLRVAVQAANAQGVTLRFEVSDTGIGMTAEQLDQVFEAFAQADASTTRRFGGTGLGLAISKRLVQLMHGHIGAYSRLGAGSTFWVELPLQRAAAAQAVLPPVDNSLSEARLHGARILVVEDNPVNQEVTAALLGAFGAVVELAASGEEALRSFDRERHDLILMDVQMPGMDGMRATEAIRRRPGGLAVPIVAMTANAFAEDRAACLAAGMNDHLAKPVEPQALAHCLLRWLQKATIGAGPNPLATSAAAANSVASEGSPNTTPDALPDAAALQRSRIESLPGMDTAPPLARMRGAWGLYLRMLRMFVSHHAHDADRLAELALAADSAALRTLTHSLDGAAATVGATEVMQQAQALQAAISAAGGAAPGPAAAQPLAEALRRCLQQLQAALAGDQPA